ncbi:MAG TPA: PIN domain-containing protein [Caulobacteraceae bacterium]
MTTFLDTNILIYLLDSESSHHKWSVDQLDICKQSGPAVISDIVYCEFAVGMETQADVDLALSELAVERIAATDTVLFRAAEAFRKYRDLKGQKNRVLPDFLIGAMAEVHDAPLITNNSADFETYFPKLVLIAPGETQ